MTVLETVIAFASWMTFGMAMWCCMELLRSHHETRKHLVEWMKWQEAINHEIVEALKDLERKIK